MRYGVVYLKGGVGKTTIAVHLATHFAKTRKTLLIDGDPQESSASWAAWRREVTNLTSPVTVRLRGNAIFDEGQALQESYDDVVIDAGGRDGAGLRNTLLLADKLIVPMGNSGLDAAVLEEFLERVEEARSFNRNLELRIVLTRIDTRSSHKDLINFLKKKGINTFQQTIGERRIYPKAMSEGLTADEFRPRTAAATHELKCFYAEVESWK